jgi:acyl-CoA reductase-like NAD-dependent aldehyde dehydrogenase
LEEQATRDIQAASEAPSAPAVERTDLGPPSRPFIDGGPRGGRDELTVLVDPSTGQPYARIAYATEVDVDSAAESAARSAALWRSTEFKERGRRLRRLSELIRENVDPLARLIAQEQGKPYLEALALEILPALDHLRFIIGQAERYQAGLAVDPRHPFYAHKHAHYLYDPVGVVALVTPSPMPFSIPLVQIAAALAMGNAVVLKPHEAAPFSALRIGELCIEAGFPAGVVNVVPTQPETGIHLVAHPKVDKVFVTGSLVTGQTIMAAAGCTPRPVVLNLGGKHPSIVAGDAQVERAARGVVWGALANAGQNCGSVERVFVEERIASEFIDHVKRAVGGVRVGNPLADGVDMGPLFSEARRREVHAQVTEAVAAGGQLACGGVIPEGPGFFYPPTVILEAPLASRLMHEETMGPVIPIVVVESLERAIMLANDSEYALTASGWSTSAEKAERMMLRLQAGVVTVNDVLYSNGEPASTWSGHRKSGLGQNHGRPGLREMSRQRFVSYDPFPAEAPIFSYPYDDEASRMIDSALGYLHADSRWQRWRALLGLARQPRFRGRGHLRRLLMPGRRGER